MSLLTAQEIYTRWGDEVATARLGRRSLRLIIEMDGFESRGTHVLKQVIDRVKKDGGPTTSPPTKSASSNASVAYIKQRRAAMMADSEESDSVNVEDGPEFEPVQIDHGLIEYDEESDTYRTYVSKAKAWVKTSGEAHRAIIRWYSNWDGAPVSLNGISRRTGLPRNWVAL